jgi:hypothetical protein
MTNEEFLTNYKRRGGIVWKCKTCGVRLIGRPASWHFEKNPDHILIDEDDEKDESNGENKN